RAVALRRRVLAATAIATAAGQAPRRQASARMSTLAAGLADALEATRTAPGAALTMSQRTRRLLQGAIVPTLLTMAWPNILVMTAQASTGLIETWWVSR